MFAPTTTVISQSETHRCGSIGPVLMMYWRGTPTIEGILPRREWLEHAQERFSAFGFLIVIEDFGVPGVPSSAFMQEAHDQIKLVRDLTFFTAFVVEGEGIVSSLVRTFLRGQTRFRGREHHTQSMPDVRSATSWISKQLAPSNGPDAMTIFDAAKRLRAS